MVYPTFTMCGGAVAALMVQITADQQQYLGGGVGHLRLVAGDGAGEDVVDDHGRDRCNQAQCGSQEGLGDAWGDDGQVGGLGLGDADEAVHDAPHGTEQPDERGGRADGGEHAGAAAHGTAAGSYQALQAEADAFLDAFFLAGVGRQAHLFEGIVDQGMG